MSSLRWRRYTMTCSYQYRLFPPSEAPQFGVGDEVFVKPDRRTCCGCGTVLGGRIEDPSSPLHGRVEVQLECCRSRRVHVRSGIVRRWTKAVLICSETSHYRQLSRSQPGPNDTILEVKRHLFVIFDTDSICRSAHHSAFPA